MKTFLTLLISTVLLTSCNSGIIEKPDNLIDEKKMVNIIYDLSVLEAIRLNNPASLEQRKINPTSYIYKKYKIDSLQFAKSDRYYAYDIQKYAGIYDEVNKKLDYNKRIADTLAKKQKEAEEKAKKDSTVKKDTVAEKTAATERRLKKRQLLKVNIPK